MAGFGTAAMSECWSPPGWCTGIRAVSRDGRPGLSIGVAACVDATLLFKGLRKRDIDRPSSQWRRTSQQQRMKRTNEARGRKKTRCRGSGFFNG
jgi:hypothetical protein